MQTLVSVPSCVKAWWPKLAWVLDREFNSGWNFPGVKSILRIESMISDFVWHLLTDRLWIHYTRGDFSSAPLSVRPIALYKELISCHAFRPDYLKSKLSSGSVWGLKGLHQWNYPIWAKLRVCIRTEGVTSIDLSLIRAIELTLVAPSFM